MQTKQLLDKYKNEFELGLHEYIANDEQKQFKATISNIIDNIAKIDISKLFKEELGNPYKELVEMLVYHSIKINEFNLADSVYDKLLPGFINAFLNEKDIKKKEVQLIHYPSLIMNFFTIQHHLNRITDKHVTSLATVIKFFKHYNGCFYTIKPLFIELLFDKHNEWKDEVDIHEEENFWIELNDWMIQDFLNATPDNLSLYTKAKNFYITYKKSNRLDPLAYRAVEYVTLIIGVAEDRLKYSTLVDKAAIFLKYIKQPFCERYKGELSNIFSQILELWTPSNDFDSFKRLSRLIDEINSTSYKQEAFKNIIINAMDITKWYKSKAYKLIANVYLKGLLTEKEVGRHQLEIAYSLSEINEQVKAKQLYEELISSGKDTPAALNNVALIYRDIDNNLDKALEYFERALGLAPDLDLIQTNVKETLEMIKKEKEKPKRQIENYFKKTDKKLKSICFTIYKLEDLERISTEDIENVSSLKGSYLKKHLLQLQNLELIYQDEDKGWRLETPIYEKVANFVDPKLERQIIRNNQAVMYRPIFYHESEINLYRILMELFPQHFVFPNMDLKTIIQVEKISNHIDKDLMEYLFKAHVDFAIIDTTTYFPILTFERDSEYQDIEPQKSNALKKNTIFETSGLPLIRIRYNSAMDYERVKEEIKQATKEYILQITGNTDAESRRILESIDPKRFGIVDEPPTDEELKETWEHLVGEAIVSHTKSLILEHDSCILRITVDPTVKQVLELGSNSIKSEFYQKYPQLNSIVFIWS
ncbi:DUF2726 domain-containing protein [Oceanobacillus caeni]|uniref:DUF2726 domain-containing protein n=1 Tax=Virgibacillus sp. SK37 TaxID=403957 RepID=UPI0011A5FD8D|nr:DUF2726 domain-containing protein [Virgibacillus sp. SK37]